MTSIYKDKKTYRAWSSPILLALKERADEMDPDERQVLEKVLAERRLINIGNPSGKDRRHPNS